MARLPGLLLLGVLWLIGVRAKAQPLVDPGWLKASLGQGGLVVLDVRSAVDGRGEADYRQGHIPGAVHSDYLKDGWRITDANGTPGMLPDVSALERLIGGLGIDNETHVIIIPAGETALDVGSATRIYWTFKVLGHDPVSILDGGMVAWTADPSNPLESGINVPKPKAFKANR